MTHFRPAAVRAVIFDMDGLLLDSERIAYSIGREASEHLGLPWDHEVAMRMIGSNSRDGYQLLRDAFGPDFPIEEHQAEFGRRYERAIDEGRFPLKPGAHELLDLLEAMDLPRAVATSTRRSRALPKLAAVGLLERFSGVVAGDEISRGKPAPDIYLAAARLMHTPAQDCLVLEDSNTGVRGALAAGAQVLMVPDMLAPAEDVLASGVRAVASLSEVARLLAAGRDGA
jgi:HAD superfamily hydrolase (TIGR01509 family)